jgi:hydroxypyruvate isomerase
VHQAQRLGWQRTAESKESQLARVSENLAYIAEQARAADVTVMVESLNTFDNGVYLLTSTPDALALIDRVKSPNVQYQFDVYHMQRMEGNIVGTLRAQASRIGHQVADPPGRNQPGSGELNFPLIFQEIDTSGYKDWVGLEYNARGSTEQSLEWLPRDRRAAR